MDVHDSSDSTSSYADSLTSSQERESLISAESFTTSSKGSQRNGSEDHNSNTSATQQCPDNEREDGSPSASATQAAKAIDMAEGDEWIPTTPSAPASLATSSSDPYGAYEQENLFAAGPPPPDYAEAIAQRETGPLESTDNDSLYAADDPVSSASLPSQISKTPRWKAFVRRHWKKFFLLNLSIYCILATVFLAARPATRMRTKQLDSSPPDYPFGANWPNQGFHEKTKQCNFDSFTRPYFFGVLDSEAFSFEETLESDYQDFGNVSISGNIELRPAPYHQTDAVEIVISYATTSSWQAGIPEYDFSSQGLRLHRALPQVSLNAQQEHVDLKRSASREPACLDIWIGIYINTQFDNFSIYTENMHIDVGPSRFLNVASWCFRIRDWSKIFSRKGNITTSGWDSRYAHISSESGSIRGTYSLNNDLHLETQSGDIDVDIWQEASFMQGYMASHPPGTAANLSTATASGNQKMKIWQPANGIAQAVFSGLGYPYLLRSSHYSDTGSVSVRVGDRWEGNIHAQSSNGSIELEGDGVDPIPDPVDGLPFGRDSRQVWAKKGSLGSHMRVETQSGDVHVYVEDGYEFYDS